MTEDDARAFARDVLARADVAYLSTVDADGYPHTRAMFNLRNGSWFPRQIGLFREHEDDFLVCFSTNASSSKVARIGADPRASAYYCLDREYRGLLLVGDLERVDDRELRHAIWNEGWERYYPGGPDDPDHAVILMRPRRAEGWRDSCRFEFSIEPGHELGV